MTPKEFAKKLEISARTVYRWIDNGDIPAKKIGGRWIIEDDILDDNFDIEDDKNDDSFENDTQNYRDNTIEVLLKQKETQIEQLKSENEYLQEELSKANKTIAETHGTIADMQKRHDTIVLSLSNQINKQQKALEDFRDRTLWTRLKAAFSFAS